MNQAINISNYEEHVVDYLDGTLSDELRTSFESFLIAHPNINAEVEELKSMDLSLTSSNEGMDRSLLALNVSDKEGIHEGNYEMAFALEPDSRSVAEFVTENPKLQRDAALYAAAQLKADSSIVYTAKADLRKALPLWESATTISWRAAAAIAVLLGVYTLLNNSEVNTYTPRDGNQSYASLEVASSSQALVSENLTTSNRESAPASMRENTSVQLAFVPNPELPRNWVPAEVEERQIPMIAFQDSRTSSGDDSDPVATVSKTQELTIAQLIGREVLGIDPKKATTTQALLKEGAKKIIDQSDQLALDTDQTQDKRKILSIRAAGIEFKRVRYLASN